MHVLTARRGQRYPDLLIGMFAEPRPGAPDLENGIIPLVADKIAMSLRLRRQNRPTHIWDFDGKPADAEKLLRHLCRRHHCVWLWAPDLYRVLLCMGFFDLIGPGKPWILEVQPKEGETTKTHKWQGFAVLEGRVTILVCRLAGGGVLHCCDTSNIGLEPPPPELKTIGRKSKAVRGQVEDWIGWLERNDMGTLQHTISSQAFYGFRKHLPKIPVMVHDYVPALGLERAALHGGRCEAFVLGKVNGPVYHLDFSSLYGWCAANFDMPVLFNCYRENWNEMRLFKGIDYIADVDLDLPAPIAPFRDLELNLLVFPIGRFRTALCGPELALCRQFIRKVHRIAAYQMAPLFATWAASCWKERMKAAAAGQLYLEQQLKLFSQVLYGKFGQQRIGWRRAKWPGQAGAWECWSHVDAESGQIDDWRSLAGRTEKKFRGGETNDSCPAISAWIASLARRRLWELIIKVGRENVYYTDTDSIWTNQVGFGRTQRLGVVLGQTLGGLRLVGRHRWVEFIGWKHYRTPEGLVCAGAIPENRQGTDRSIVDYCAEHVTAATRQGRAPRAAIVPNLGERPTVYRHGIVTGSLVNPFERKDW